jgi:2-keto-4-pentenoate hydratase/2-oxohepta-3-ene-1,7-dioic acid hydratase in catechol pathway
VRFVTFITAAGGPRVGLLVQDGSVLDLAGLAAGDPGAEPVWGHDLVALIESGEAGVAWAQRQLEKLPSGHLIAAGAYELMAPIPRPRKNVFCVGLNYRDHVAEHDRHNAQPRALPTTPVFFTKPPTTVNSPGADIPWHPATSKLDYEIELALIIGPGGKDIPMERAWDHIFGYTIINDVSARDLQQGHGGQWFKGKALDGACPMGPVVVHRSALPDADKRDFVCKVNGEVRQQSNTSMMIFDIPTLISTLSAGLTLEPGDIIATGTCSGVGSGFVPPRFLQDGDEVEMTIDGIGTLRNRVRRV